jgi:hypothetical protein
VASFIPRTSIRSADVAVAYLRELPKTWASAKGRAILARAVLAAVV